MFTRRDLLAGAALAVLSVGASFAPAHAQEWKKQYPELVMAVVPAENALGVGERYAGLVAYLSRELGVPVKLRIANDYAAVIEGQRAGNIHIAHYGPAAYATAYMTGAKVEPFVTVRKHDGSIGYYSVIYVKADSPYKDIKDLKGKTIGFVDPNSTSGYNAPRFFLNKAGIDPDAFFGKSVITGSHENAIIALDKGAVDCAANWWNAEDDSNLARMANKGMVKKENFRIAFRSGLLAGSPKAYLASLPDELKKAIVKAFLEVPTKDKVAFDRLSDGQDIEYVPVSHKDYVDTIEMIQYVNDLRKKRS
jgi:phosphonate transport system substrate-binding protein